jgi:aspartate-semialdehyde dehydrogenase
MDPRVPLVVPEINPDALRAHQGLVANPNCSTIIALMALAPLHRAAGLKRVVACTYQAVSGSGSDAVKELDQQVREWVAGNPSTPRVYPHPIAFNVLAQVGGVKDESGSTSEELKLERETRKILADDNIQISSTCVRVPVFNGHTEALHIELRKPLDPAEARQILETAEGVHVMDDMVHSVYPTPLACSGREQVMVGRLRKDPTVENGLALVVAGDNLWKGAALNAIQIAEKMVELGVERAPDTAFR